MEKQKREQVAEVSDTIYRESSETSYLSSYSRYSILSPLKCLRDKSIILICDDLLGGSCHEVVSQVSIFNPNGYCGHSHRLFVIGTDSRSRFGAGYSARQSRSNQPAIGRPPIIKGPHGCLQSHNASDGTYAVKEVPLAETHYNVKNLLFPPKCIDCFLVQLLEVVGNRWKFSVTIKNPTQITGYDVRCTCLKLGKVIVLNPSSYTKTFAYADDTDPINPFVVFDSGNGQNQWGPGAQATAIVSFFKPSDENSHQ